MVSEWGDRGTGATKVFLLALYGVPQDTRLRGHDFKSDTIALWGKGGLSVLLVTRSTHKHLFRSKQKARRGSASCMYEPVGR